MGKDGRYARRHAVKPPRVVSSAEQAQRSARREAEIRGASRVDGRFERGEISMIMELVQLRINILAGQAAYDERVETQRERWVMILRKLGEIGINGG